MFREQTAKLVPSLLAANFYRADIIYLPATHRLLLALICQSQLVHLGFDLLISNLLESLHRLFQFPS